MRLKIVISAIVLPFISTAVLANGFYVGAGAGPDLVDFDVNAKVRQVQGAHVEFNVKNDAELSGTGIFGTLFAGYGVKFYGYGPMSGQHFYLAGEVNGNLSTLVHKDSNDEFVHSSFSSTKFKMPYSYGISAIPGYLYTDSTMFYGRLGYSNGNFKISTSDTSLANIKRNLSGFRLGLGLQQAVAFQYAVRVEYSHIFYNSTNVSTLDALSNTTKVTNFRPNSNEVEFGLIYNLC